MASRAFWFGGIDLTCFIIVAGYALCLQHRRKPLAHICARCFQLLVLAFGFAFGDDARVHLADRLTSRFPDEGQDKATPGSASLAPPTGDGALSAAGHRRRNFRVCLAARQANVSEFRELGAWLGPRRGSWKARSVSRANANVFSVFAGKLLNKHKLSTCERKNANSFSLFILGTKKGIPFGKNL
jgi:hypothetical protein